MTLGNMVYHFLFLGFSQKGGSAMNCTVTIDWKFVVALGVPIAATIFALKMSPAQATMVSVHAIDACKEYVEALPGDC